MPYNANTSIVRTNNTFRQGELARKRVHRQGQEVDSALPFWWICYGILPEWSKGADLRSARRLSAWVQTPQVPIVLHFLFIRIYDVNGCECGYEISHHSVFCFLLFINISFLTIYTLLVFDVPYIFASYCCDENVGFGVNWANCVSPFM